jgi:hypothetical protein
LRLLTTRAFGSPNGGLVLEQLEQSEPQQGRPQSAWGGKEPLAVGAEMVNMKATIAVLQSLVTDLEASLGRLAATHTSP